MTDDNKHNLLYFEGASMRELYDTMENWQKENRKRLQSVDVQRDGDMFCCIALSNPSEVVIVSGAGNQEALVGDGLLGVGSYKPLTVVVR